MRRALFTGLLLTSAHACGNSHKDAIPPAEAGAGGEAGQSSGSGGNSSGRGGNSGSSSSGASGEGGDNGESGEGGTAGASGGAAGKGGDSTGGSSVTGGAGGAAGRDGSGGVAGSTAGTTSAGAGGVNAGAGGTGGAAAGAGGLGGLGGGGGLGGSNAGKGGTGGGGASGSLLFFDDFESGTSRWTSTPSGVWATATDGSTVYAVTAAPPSSAVRVASAGESTWSDVAIDARVKVTGFAGTSSSYFAGVCARYQSSSNYACFTLRSNGQVGFRVNGSNTTATTPPGGTIATGTWYSIRVVAIGSNITAFVNGTEINAASRVTSGAPLNGSIALFAPGTNAVFDDVRVTVP